MPGIFKGSTASTGNVKFRFTPLCVLCFGVFFALCYLSYDHRPNENQTFSCFSNGDTGKSTGSGQLASECCWLMKHRPRSCIYQADSIHWSDSQTKLGFLGFSMTPFKSAFLNLIKLKGRKPKTGDSKIPTEAFNCILLNVLYDCSQKPVAQPSCCE